MECDIEQLNEELKVLKEENEQLKKDLEYKERVIEIYQQRQEENMKNCQGDVE